MATEKQIKANRESAKKGGVKTSEGKAIVRYNALKHGLLSKEVLLEGEEERNLIKLEKRIRVELKPKNILELILTDRITANIWRLRRLLEVERNTMEWQTNYELRETTHFDSPKDQIKRKAIKEMIVNEDMEKLLRYETTIERSIYRALHELQRIQSARKGEKPPTPTAIDVDVSANK
jgi:hypothetical protein